MKLHGLTPVVSLISSAESAEAIHPPLLFELRPSPTVVGYGRRRSEGPARAFIPGLSLLRRSSLGYQGRAPAVFFRRRINRGLKSEVVSS